MSTPIVTIITITYNAEIVIEKTIQSVLNQTYSDFEHLIIDGKSTDGTIAIVEKYEADIRNGNYAIFPHQFRWISEPDTGLYHAMNKGIELAKGNYIWFMNAGDKIHANDTLEKIAKKINENQNPTVLYGQSLIIDQNDRPLGERHKIAPSDLHLNHMLNGLVVCHQSILVKRDKAPLYDLQYRIASDYDWVIKVLMQSESNIYMDDYLSNFMIAGTSSVNRKRAWKERYCIMKKHFGLCKTLWAHFKIVLKYPFTRKY
ncbi:MAG TPA: glycosyltransferase family 2 protein [Bacteroidales bacterium]|nr:glycosyltransferase family 2 protein [Bacteroidales bacterium]HOR82626.1 glycosyltransferase family 2 protein [Bacteroidales bacterium]HPJ91783.1 glycosyltransferase family 2 protein [Bacteroidales bacterium]